MFGNFQRYSQVEKASEAEWLRQIDGPEAVVGDLQKIPSNMMSVNSEYVVHAESLKNRKPGSVTTADIHNCASMSKL